MIYNNPQCDLIWKRCRWWLSILVRDSKGHSETKNWYADGGRDCSGAPASQRMPRTSDNYQKIGKILVISLRTSRRSQLCQFTCIWMSGYLTSKHYTTQCMDSFRKSIHIFIHLQNPYRNVGAGLSHFCLHVLYLNAESCRSSSATSEDILSKLSTLTLWTYHPFMPSIERGWYNRLSAINFRS